MFYLCIFFFGKSTMYISYPLTVHLLNTHSLTTCVIKGGNVIVYLCNNESAAHTQRVIVESSHGHLFVPDDIIMEIPIQDRTISMNLDKVKVGSQA